MSAVFEGSNLVVVQTRTVFIVPHTHWDREWYLPFQRFRLQLVQTMDELLEILERDPSFSCFVLDGQMAMVDDYLEVRPEKRVTIRRLAHEHRLELGPFYVLADEFLPSGETLITNIQMGVTSTESFGQTMEVGYLPDMFGHIAQMPQLLRLMGIDKAVVWRGVPKRVDKDKFWWTAPNGSSVLALYLIDGYANGAFIPEDPQALIELTAQLETGRETFFTSFILIMAGNDHKKPNGQLGRVIEEANVIQRLQSAPRYRFKISGISQLFQLDNHAGLVNSADQSKDDSTLNPSSTGLPIIEGELRSSTRANVLMGTISNRMDVKLAAYQAERALEALAEPMCSLFLPKENYPETLLMLAWKKLVLNSAHDSICACSIDEVVDQVLVRYDEARQIAEGLYGQVLEHLSELTPLGKMLVLNISPRNRSGVVEVLSTGEWRTEWSELEREEISIQLVEELPVIGESVLDTDAAGVLSLLKMISSNQLFENMFLHDVKVSWIPDGSHPLHGLSGMRTDDSEVSTRDSHRKSELPSGAEEISNEMADEHLLISVVLASIETGRPDIDALRNEIARLVARYPQTPVKIQLKGVPVRRLLMRVEEVPGYGWRSLYIPGPDRLEGIARGKGTQLVRHGDTVRISNGLITVEAGFPDGTYSVNGLNGLGRLVDSGDNGDTYNYCPPPHDRIVDVPDSTSVKVLEEGPVRARVEVISTYDWPTAIDKNSGKRIGSRKVIVRTELTVLAGEPWVRAKVGFVNTHQDHRLRTVFPLPYPVAISKAKSAFAIIERGLRSEGGGGEYPLATFPSAGFVNAGTVTVAHQGCVEYELIEVEEKNGAEFANALALTLLRSVSMLSTAANSLRAGPAGPSIELSGSKMLGNREFSYAITTTDLDPYAMSEDVFLPLEIIYPKTKNPLSDGERQHDNRLQILRIEGAQVSRVHRVEEELEIRVFNPHPRECELAVTDGEGRKLEGQVVNLRGAPISAFNGSAPLRPFEICTIRLQGI